eukprot:TRINITY_DN9421_c0_g1_i3.p8 TRINITY_DN9421_c0_g1~~TRINITY_DN9421_c0_g1_i3.p8  ORF type:complete len:124 (-),score=12.45 TRINITY_DN9421_c0_g1_i3:921-1292(-)
MLQFFFCQNNYQYWLHIFYFSQKYYYQLGQIIIISRKIKTSKMQFRIKYYFLLLLVFNLSKETLIFNDFLFSIVLDDVSQESLFLLGGFFFGKYIEKVQKFQKDQKKMTIEKYLMIFYFRAFE